MHALLPPFINEQISRILLVSSANTYLGYHKKWKPTFLGTLTAFYIIREPLLWFYGYYPMSSSLGAGVDIPSDVIRQWARWTLHRQCFVDDKGQMLTDGFNSVKCPILALSFADDKYFIRQAFDAFTKQFHQSSNIQTWHLPKGGHLNFFKESQSVELWKDIVPFLKYGDTNLSNVNK